MSILEAVLPLIDQVVRRVMGEDGRRGPAMGRMARRGSAMGRMARGASAAGRMAPMSRKARRRPAAGRMRGRALPPMARPTRRRAAAGRGRGRATPLIGLAMTAAGVAVLRWLTSRSREMKTKMKERDSRTRWCMVTINCPPERLSSRSDLPEPMARLGDTVDIKISRAPGDRGTELGARLREERPGMGGMMARIAGGDPRRAVRRALREAKALIEADEVIRRDEAMPARRPTPAGKLMEFTGRRGGRQ